MEISKEEYAELVERAIRSEQKCEQLTSEMLSIRESLNRLDIKLDQILACLDNTELQSCKKEIQMPSVPHENPIPIDVTPKPFWYYPYITTTRSGFDHLYRPELGPTCSSDETNGLLHGKQFISGCISRILSTSNPVQASEA